MEDDGRRNAFIDCGETCWKRSGDRSGDDIPKGWVVMTIDDVKKNQAECRAELGEWDIVALQDGTIDGAGYGYSYHYDDVRRCTIGTKLLMQDDGSYDRMNFGWDC